MKAKAKDDRPILRKVSRGYQITLPPEFREKTHLSIGDHVRIEQQGCTLIITAVSDHRQKMADELATALAEPVEGEDFENEDEAIRFAIEQIKRYREEKKKSASRQK